MAQGKGYTQQERDTIIESLQITPYSKNAKKHPNKQLQQIADSVNEFGWQQDIVVDKEGVIIAGHGRYAAYKKHDLPEPPIKVADLTEKQANAYRLADNKLNESEWDMPLVIEELKTLEELAPLTGFDMDLMIEPDEADDVVPDVPETPQSVLGDLYELGEHRVLCGDSTKIDDVEKLMDGKKADMVFTDPPYGMNFDIKNDDDNFKQVFVGAVANMYVFSKKENWYICGNFRCLSFFHLEIEKIGLELYEKIVWVKNLYGQGKLYNRMHEDILFCGSGSFYKVDKDVDVWKEDSVRNFMGSKNAHEAVGHPTQKPVNLCARAIGNSSKNEDIILDLFLGSGSTLIAAEKTGRICYGMELDPKYVDVIVQRYVDYTGNATIKLNGKEITWTKTETKP